MDQAASSPLQEELGRAPSSQELKAYRQKRRRARASLSSCLPPEPVTLLLFYTYAPTPMSKHRQTEAVRFSLNSLKKNNLTGRLRIAREGYNGTLTGSKKGVRAFTASLEMFDCATFGNQRVDFKYVDGLPHNQALKGLKCWPVTEIVTYGFDPRDAPLDAGGHHLSPQVFHAALTDPDAVVVDVRNFNETIIGRFAPAAGAQVLDPGMRRSTEFPRWIAQNREKLTGKKVLLYCTGGVRCERASAFMGSQGIKNIFQLEGGVHRYLEHFNEGGGHWIGKNYTFDKRFSHGAVGSEVISRCTHCGNPWDRYQAQAKCTACGIEVLLCRSCQRLAKSSGKALRCPLCQCS
mmetsp:Transcript_20650/g.64959  ORF Transcript_20650/g.64959 Transcript_20650/m.64959 type:complete len:349 (-) Transcript_20650:224-1270(-)